MGDVRARGPILKATAGAVVVSTSQPNCVRGIDNHLPSGASECLFSEAADRGAVPRRAVYRLARLATAGGEGEASGRD